MSSSSEQGFPERWRDRLECFTEEAIDILSVDRNSQSFENVLVRLSEQISSRIRLVYASSEPGVSESDVHGRTITKINLPAVIKRHDAFLLAMDFLKINEGSSSEWKKMNQSYMWNEFHIQRISAYLYQKYGDDALIFANLLYITGFDCVGEDGRAVCPEQVIESSVDFHKGIAQIIAETIQDEESKVFDKKDIFSLGHFSGFSIRNRLMRYETLDEVFAVLERLLATNKNVRGQFLLLLQNFRHKPHDEVVRLIADMGYQTLLNVDAMTEYDIWEKLEREQFRSAQLAALEGSDEKMKMARDIDLEDGDPDILRYLSTDVERNVWRKADEYLATHQREPRIKLRDKLPLEKYKAELAELRGSFQWEALGAKEREIVNHVYSEVIRIGYAYAEDESRLFSEISFLTGTPSYAVDNQRLTCFTGPWLIAALCLECGIPYERLYYCNVNQSYDNQHAGSHAALLVRYSDGPMGFVDYGYKKSNRSLSMGLIEKPADAKKLNGLFVEADKWAKDHFKVTGDPVHVSVSYEVAKQNSIYSDMHVLPLDQGFAATQLLHTGLSLADEGKMDDALEAFELGLTLFPTSCDLLCQCAIVHFDRGDLDRAEWLLGLALSEYTNHLLSIFYLAKIYHIQGKTDEALILFNKIGLDTREIWGDASVKSQANRYCVQHQLKQMTIVTLEMIDELLQTQDQNSGTSILTRCEDYLL